jgi:hypothetical protein
MAQMINNPAREAYIKFDALAKTMQVAGKSTAPKKNNNFGGLLKRLKEKKTDDESKEQEPIEIALDYFIAIRQQRNNMKKKV